jgi:hypothetical protein
MMKNCTYSRMEVLRSPHVISLLAVLSLYVATRLHHLLEIPLFIDEALHMEFAKEAMAGDYLAGTSWGKWLSIQAYGAFMNAFGDSPLVARLLGVLMGFLTTVILFIEGTTFDGFSWIRGALGALIYVVAPFALFHDRVALTDQFQVCLLALMVLFCFRLMRSGSLFNRAGLWLTLLLSPLFKLSGFFFAPVPILLVAFCAAKELRWREFRKLAMPYLLSLPPAAVFLTCFPVNREFNKLATGTSLRAVFELAGRNTGEIAHILWAMLTPGLCLSLLVGTTAVLLLSRDVRNRKRAAAMFAVAVVLMLPIIFLFQTWYPRYLLPLLVPLSLLGGETGHLLVSSVPPLLRGTSRLFVPFLLMGLMLVNPAVSSFRLLSNPLGFRHIESVKSEYFTGWTSGYGLREAVALLHRLSQSNPTGVFVVRLSTWDQPFTGLNVYYEELGPNVKLFAPPLRNPGDTLALILRLVSAGLPTYFLFNEAYPYPNDRAMTAAIDATFSVQEVHKFPKPGNSPGLCLWRVAMKPEFR